MPFSYENGTTAAAPSNGSWHWSQDIAKGVSDLSLKSGCCNNSAAVNGHNGVQRTWPEDVGIINIEMYFPSEYIEQSELEEFDGVSKGKYVIGLGQTRMAICSDHEDINSICLTVTQNLMEKANITSKDVGFLMVGTETIIDKSKSVKSVLMQLFGEDTDIQGLDTTNACFGGTAALHHAVDWVESSSWDGRYAIVVCGDIAVYAEGPARPTNGAGAVAMLIGPNAPLIFDRGVRTYYAKNAYDFYKPVLDSEYPIVNGHASMVCYYEAAIKCLKEYKRKVSKVCKMSDDHQVTLGDFDALIFHAPFCKMVQKALTRLALVEYQSNPNPDHAGKYKGAEKFREYSVEDTLTDREFEGTFLKIASDLMEKKIKPNLLLPTEIGNMYTASMYSCLVSYLATNQAKDIAGKRILLFSYGSGLVSSMFSIRISTNSAVDSQLNKLTQGLQPTLTRLSKRLKIDCKDFSERLKRREEQFNKAPFVPVEDLGRLFPGTYHLLQIDDKHCRTYARTPLTKSA